MRRMRRMCRVLHYIGKYWQCGIKKIIEPIIFSETYDQF